MEMKFLVGPKLESWVMVVVFSFLPFILKTHLYTTELLSKLYNGLSLGDNESHKLKITPYASWDVEHHVTPRLTPQPLWVGTDFLQSIISLGILKASYIKNKYKWKCVYRAANKCREDWVHISHMVFLGKNNHYMILQPRNMKFRFISKIWHLVYFCYPRHIILGFLYL